MKAIAHSTLLDGSRRGRLLRAGFTLLELLIVIVIIGILISILVPAVVSVMRRGRDAQVRKDISDLEQAITQFKTVYGIEPPSSITLYAATAGWNTDARSKGVIRQLWRSFNFSNCGGASNGTAFTSLTGSPTSLSLNGAECLVFFLGGITDPTAGLVGFAKDPAHPFLFQSVAHPSSSLGPITNRDGPFFEFKLPRVINHGNTPLPEYRDPLTQQTQPYVYFNSNASNYRYENVAPSVAPFPSPTPTWRNTDCLGLMNFAYFSQFNSTNARASTPYKPKGFQIISPGADGLYGTGGGYDPNNTNNLSREDRDNITNFADGGRLAN